MRKPEILYKQPILWHFSVFRGNGFSVSGKRLAITSRMMCKALRAKFEQHAELRTLLLATASAKLVEHTQNDAYWGDGGNGQGKNRLGYLLMALRGQLAAEK
ncbi:DUF1768 domain-containing protein [Escherichia coli]|nr:Swarming motility protein ybiA [Escherichia coli]EYV88628.1 hypothetical protein BY41_20560 [Escherichia coli O86:H34 str. 99-3124]EEW9407723.1 DUF1768 domain-containing protein [Escherichia coli]EFN9943321.1 DUF1768 domain-containing protein [Escherichia coli]EGD9745539.1 DUF1768 domain-containing protein [Escherichia coli]